MTSPPPSRPLTRATLATAARRLASVDRDLGVVVATHGLPPLWPRRPGFATLVDIILGQQVSLASGAATYRRLSAAAGRITPHRVLAHTHGELTRLGLTRQKARYCRELASAIVDDGLDLAALRHASDDQVRRELTRVVGIGRWTADIYLLMALRRPDVWPRGDLALYQAFRELKRRDDEATRLDELARRWRPWRAVAARILWHHYLCVRRG